MMNAFNEIISPTTSARHSLFSNKGKQLLKSYIKYIQTGGGMKINRYTGLFIGYNRTGKADSFFLNNLGMRGYRGFNSKDLDNFINYPYDRPLHMNMSLVQALESIPDKYMKIDDGNRKGPEQDIKHAIDARVVDGSRFQTHHSGHVHWGATLGKIHNLIRTYKTYVNNIKYNTDFTISHRIKLRNSMINESLNIHQNVDGSKLYDEAFEQASATEKQHEADIQHAKDNVAKYKELGLLKSSSSDNTPTQPTSKQTNQSKQPTSKQPKQSKQPTSKQRIQAPIHIQNQIDNLKGLLEIETVRPNPRTTIINNMKKQLQKYANIYT